MDKRPSRYRNAVVAHIYVEGAAGAIAFYEKAFGAQETIPRQRQRRQDRTRRDLHLRLSDHDRRSRRRRSLWRARKLGGCTAGLHLMVDDNEALLHRATAAGAEEVQPVTEMFYGASSCSVRDPFGHVWVLLSWKEDPDAAEIERRGAALLSQ